MHKSQLLDHWRKLEPNQPVAPEPIPYGHEGSTYGADSIRVTGSPEFVDAVLSRFQDLLAHENGRTRLQVSYQRVKPRDDKPANGYADGGRVAAYVQVMDRGPQSLGLMMTA